MLDSEFLEDFRSVEGAENLAGRLVAQFLPRIGIDVAHHKFNVILGEPVKACSFGEYPSDHFVCHLAAALLVGTQRIAIKDFRAHISFRIALDGTRIRELAPTIRQKDREQFTEHIPSKDFVQAVEAFRDRPGGVVFPQEREHKRAVREIDRQQDASPPLRPSTESISTVLTSGIACR